MSDTYGTRPADPEDGWSRPRPVHTGTSGAPLPPELSPRRKTNPRRPVANATSDPALGAAPVLGRVPNANRPIPRTPVRETAPSEPESSYGLPGWAALLVLIAIAGVGGLIDLLNGTQARGGFNVGIVAASIAAILIVRRSSMFPVVVAPPIVYSLASGSVLYLRSNGLHDHKVVIDTAANWLVYGFPAIAAASASVLIIAGIRMLIRR